MSVLVSALMRTESMDTSVLVIDMLSNSLAQRFLDAKLESVEIDRDDNIVTLRNIKFTNVPSMCEMTINSVLTSHELAPILAEAVCPSLQALVNLLLLRSDELFLDEVKDILDDMTPSFLISYINITPYPDRLQDRLYDMLKVFKGDPIVTPFIIELGNTVIIDEQKQIPEVKIIRTTRTIQPTLQPLLTPNPPLPSSVTVIKTTTSNRDNGQLLNNNNVSRSRSNRTDSRSGSRSNRTVLFEEEEELISDDGRVILREQDQFIGDGGRTERVSFNTRGRQQSQPTTVTRTTSPSRGTTTTRTVTTVEPPLPLVSSPSSSSSSLSSRSSRSSRSRSSNSYPRTESRGINDFSNLSSSRSSHSQTRYSSDFGGL